MSAFETLGLNTRLRALAERYAVVAQQVLGENLTSVVLFGSVARGEAQPGSDIDLLVICRTFPPASEGEVAGPGC